jgi:hypothetical protein
VTNVLGWESIDNSVAATPGIATQSEIAARRQRNSEIALLGSGIFDAVFSRVSAVEGVSSLTLRENVTDSVQVIDGITLSPHSIWACVSGGLDSEVAFALLESKSAGSNWNNGNSGTPVSESIIEPLSGQSYDVLFDRPDQIPVLYQVTIASTTLSSPIQIVKDAILSYAAGELDGEEGLMVGSDVSPFEAAGAINVVEPAINVLNIEVSLASSVNFQPSTIPIGLFEIATVVDSSITVIVQ